MNANQKNSILIWPWLLIAFALFSTQALIANTNSSNININDYKGLWLTNIEDEAVYLIIKKNQLARYFYKNRIDNNVYKGQWSIDQDGFLLVSSSNFDVVKFRLSSDSFDSIAAYDISEYSILTKVDEDSLGVLAQHADQQTSKIKNTPSTYFGLWETKDLINPLLIKILDNRIVLKTTKNKSGKISKDFILGEWYKHGKQLHLAWEDGSYNILDNRNKKRVKLYDFAPGENIIEEGSHSILISKIQDHFIESSLINERLNLAKNNNISLANLSYKSLLKFYRGEWMAFDDTNPNAIEIMKFNRFGRVKLASDSNTTGSWYLSGKSCLINLDDGIRMRFKNIGSAFLVFIYKANRPLDGYPNKILRVAPKNLKKLDSLNSELTMTSMLLEQINKLSSEGITSVPLISNWSDRNTINPPPSSPWWWPIWIDNVEIEETNSFSSNNLPPLLTNDEDSVDSSQEEFLKSKNFLNQINKSKWNWPF